MRLDGEILLPDGTGLHWRELRDAPEGGTVLAKAWTAWRCARPPRSAPGSPHERRDPALRQGGQHPGCSTSPPTIPRRRRVFRRGAAPRRHRSARLRPGRRRRAPRQPGRPDSVLHRRARRLAGAGLHRPGHRGRLQHRRPRRLGRRRADRRCRHPRPGRPPRRGDGRRLGEGFGLAGIRGLTRDALDALAVRHGCHLAIRNAADSFVVGVGATPSTPCAGTPPRPVRSGQSCWPSIRPRTRRCWRKRARPSGTHSSPSPCAALLPALRARQRPRRHHDLPARGRPRQARPPDLPHNRLGRLPRRLSGIRRRPGPGARPRPRAGDHGAHGAARCPNPRAGRVPLGRWRRGLAHPTLGRVRGLARGRAILRGNGQGRARSRRSAKALRVPGPP